MLKPSDEYGGTGVTLGWKVERQGVGEGAAGGSARGREIQGAWVLDCAGENSFAARTVPDDCWRRESGDAGHAGGFCAVFVQGKIGGIFDEAEHQRSGECDEWWRADTFVSSGEEECGAKDEEKKLTHSSQRSAEATENWQRVEGQALEESNRDRVHSLNSL